MLPIETSANTDSTQFSSITALIQPARTHTEVIIVAVAARDKKKAEAYAKAYDIPIVHENYDSKCKILSIVRWIHSFYRYTFSVSDADS
jgi:hypothetical protein